MLDLDAIDGGEQESYSAALANARREILGALAIDSETGSVRDWRQAVTRHPFFGEVTKEACNRGAEFGKLLGTSRALLQELEQALLQHVDLSKSASSQQLAWVQAHLRDCTVFVELYTTSPVPTAMAYEAAMSREPSWTPTTSFTDAPNGDDGSVVESHLRAWSRDLRKDLAVRGKLQSLFETTVADDTLRKSILQQLSVFSAQGGSARRVDDW